ncbi:translation initiation factor [Synergistaceae bacterium OttesenSCG-928-D05]|nr:translation initiation factor [Synergistaceae bacterium OttesenSCG-928-D05]
MAKDRKKKKITEGDGFQIGSSETFGMSIGSLLGKESPEKNIAPKETPLEKNVKKTPTGNLNDALSKLQKVTLHRQSSGKGGKTVTVVTLSGAENINLDTLAKEMRKGLGCGSRVENGKVVLQGDIQDRAAEWFGKRGAKQVVRGN